MMVTHVILKVTSTANETTSKRAEDLVLWCLKGSGGEGGNGGEAGYEGLLSLMAHGDPKSAKDRDVRSVSLALSNWYVGNWIRCQYPHHSHYWHRRRRRCCCRRRLRVIIAVAITIAVAVVSIIATVAAAAAAAATATATATSTATASLNTLPLHLTHDDRTQAGRSVPT